MTNAHIGEPFLDISLSERGLDEYANNNEDDPRLFANLFKYCFPVYVAGRPDPIIFIVICRNYNRDRDTVFTDDGEFIAGGYYFAGPGITQRAATLQQLYGGRVSFVSFIDAAIPQRVIIDAPNGLRSGVEGDSLTTMQADARKIKRYALWQRDY